ncbi:MAG: hypothetical protein GY810_09980 [Aureispira sp.]|nr:hypothetical protein [Aureispira sp.]
MENAKPEALYQKVIEWVGKRGYSEIKANIDDFETPSKFVRKMNGEDQDMIPDITALKHNRKAYFEIAQKIEDSSLTVTKWKLLSTMASMKKGKLFIMAPKGHKMFTNRLVNTYEINAEVVSI